MKKVSAWSSLSLRAVANALFFLSTALVPAQEVKAQPYGNDPGEMQKSIKASIEEAAFQIGGNILNPALYARRASLYRQLYMLTRRAG
jgi:hypothetical protein